jgi:hypothetical protein
MLRASCVRRPAFQTASSGLGRLAAMALALAVAAVCGGCLQPAGSTPSSVDVRFSPNGGCTDPIERAGPGLQFHVGPDRAGVGRRPSARPRRPGLARQEPAIRKIHVRRFPGPGRRAHRHRRATCHRPQQDHDHRRGGRRDRLVQFHQERRAKQRRESADPARSGLAEKYTANWLAHARHCETYEAEAIVPRAPRDASGRDAGRDAAKPASNAAKPAPDADDSGEYVTSANSEVFHRAECRAAAKIAANHRVHYATRGEAISVGKRPCAECKP